MKTADVLYFIWEQLFLAALQRMERMAQIIGSQFMADFQIITLQIVNSASWDGGMEKESPDMPQEKCILVAFTIMMMMDTSPPLPDGFGMKQI